MSEKELEGTIVYAKWQVLLHLHSIFFRHGIVLFHSFFLAQTLNSQILLQFRRQSLILFPEKLKKLVGDNKITNLMLFWCLRQEINLSASKLKFRSHAFQLSLVRVSNTKMIFKIPENKEKTRVMPWAIQKKTDN